MSEPGAPGPESEAIAIVGMSGRFPGAPTLAVFWDNLRRGVESITFFTEDEIRRSGADPGALRDRQFVPAKPRIDGEDLFDARFFGFSPEEAEIIDPQQRLFLECAWEALEDAGYTPDRFPGLIGLFAGSHQNTYLWFNLLAKPGFLLRHGIVRVVTTNGADYLATRAGYKLNLTGPCISVQTACSTSLVAVHLACQSLNNYECDLAVVGAVALNISPFLGYFYEPGSMLSPDGHCRPFDTKAAGTLFGEGLGSVVLKRLDEAISDGDTIRAVIRGSAVNNDGAAKAGFMAVGLHGQAAVVFQALDSAGVSADSISYVEGHGTGTPIGDAVEIKALTTAFRHTSARSGYCAIGSVKGNIGHLTAAAGMAGLLKTVLALLHETIPPSGNFQTPHPELGLAGTPFVVSSGLREWRRGDAPRRAGVSAFGIGGTNAHLIVEEAPAANRTESSARPRQLVILSARTPTALAAARERLVGALRCDPGINLADVAFTLQVGRRPFEHRAAVAGGNIGEIIAALEAGRGLDHEPEGDVAAVGRRWVAGGDVDWPAFWGKERRRRLPLPTYPFERQRYWSEVAVVESARPVPTASTEAREAPAASGGRPPLSVPFREPATATERRVAGIWRDVLRVDTVGADDQFFELGGDSLIATQLINRIRSAFGRDLTVRDIVTHGTIAAIAARLGEPGQEPHLAGIERRASSRAPLSFAQERLWFLDRLDPGSAAYNLPLALEVESRIETEWVGRALAHLIRRHEILRTTFTDREGRPEQVMAAAGEPALDVVDLDGLPEHRRDAEISRLAIQAFERPFDLSTGPLLRTTLIQTPRAGSVLLFTMHHIVSDGWSVGLFAREFAHVYLAIASGREPALAALPVQYADFARWQREVFRGDERARQLEYWTGELAGLPVLDLPTDFPRPPVQTFHGAARTLTIAPGLAAAVRQLARECGQTIFATTLAAFATLLHRYASQDDVLIGSPVANRNRQETEGLIGLFVNTLVVRARFDGKPTVGELVARIADTVLRAQEHQDLPFEQLVDALQPPRDLSRNPVFQVMFAHVKSAVDPQAPPAAIQALDLAPAVSKFDLTLTVHERGDEMRAQLEYNVDLFSADTAERLCRYFPQILLAMVANRDARVADLPMLDRIERETILDVWNRTGEARDPFPTLGAALGAAAAREGDRDAIICGVDRISYGDLDRRSNRLAVRLTALGVGGDRLVGVCLPRSIDLIVSLAAVAKAGGAYVPLDPTLPPGRLAMMSEDAALSVLITEHQVTASEALAAGHTLYLDDQEQDGEPAVASLPASADSLAYVLFTSGSTGRPKGVQIPQSALMNLLAAMRRRPGLSPDDRLLAVTTLSFDIAALEIWLPLTTGATVVLASSEEATDGRALMRVLDTSGATVMQATPSTWRLLKDAGWTNPAGVRILAGGEALPPEVASFLKAVSSPGARRQVWNLYGPTETTVWSIAHEVGEVTGAVPIGRPIANTRVYILDERLEPVPVNTPGHLYVAGAGLARGYVNQPSMTAERFVPDPHASAPGSRMYATGDVARARPTGTIEFLGRADSQVKLHGHRIELGEIEQALAQHPGVRQVVAVRREDTPGAAQLVAYIVPEPGWDISTAELRDRAGRTLPRYMVPTQYLTTTEVPLTPNGKIDRARLPRPQPLVAPAAAHVEPRTDAERQMAGLWRDTLSVPVVSVDDDFFEIGGHSMLAAKLLAGVRRAFGVDLPLRSLFEAPTVATLTKVVSSVARGGSIERTLRDAESDLRADVVLAADVVPDGSTPDPGLVPRLIFLTGATGFLGAFLLHELLEQTAADIACLVRAASPEDGVRRLKDALTKHERWREHYASRVRAVPGDLDRPRFGLSYAGFEHLATTVDVVYHNGALVNFVYPYRRLKTANVGGTEEVLRLACRVRTKPVHYISTMDVWGAAYYTSGEEDDVAQTSGWTTGYAQSKWVAEQLVCAARGRGVPAAVYRPARVVGDSRSGIWNTDDFACRVIKGLVQLGCAPTVQPVDNMSPVDHVARAIVRLSIASSATRRRAFHLVNPQWFVWTRMFDFIRRRGYPLTRESYPTWWARLAEACAAGDDNALKPLLPLFPVPPDPLPPGADRPQPDPELPPVRCDNTLADLAGSGVSCPEIDEGLLDRYFDHFVRSGFLEPAPAARVHA